MEPTFNFESQARTSFLIELYPEIRQEVEDNFVELSFWLALAVLSETPEQYAQAFQNSDILIFCESSIQQDDLEIAQNIKKRLIDPEYLKVQINESQQALNHLRCSTKHNLTDKNIYYNKLNLNQANYNLLLGQSYFSILHLKEALELKFCLEMPEILKYWSKYYVEERPELSDLLENRSLDF